MIVITDQLFKITYGKFAVDPYNINNMEQTMGLFEGHIQAQAPSPILWKICIPIRKEQISFG